MQSSLKFNQCLPVISFLYQNILTTSFFCIFVKTGVHFHNVAIMKMTISRLLFLKFKCFRIIINVILAFVWLVLIGVFFFLSRLICQP